jgi:uncharacterized protein
MLTHEQAATPLARALTTTSKALAGYGPAADRGDVRAQRALGDIYHYGWGVPLDRVEAAKWYQLAAAQGDIRSQKSIAMMFSFGDGSPQDQSEAVKWYRLAAEQGDAGAQHSLGLKYLLGQGVLRDYALAYMWFSLAAAADRHDGAPDYGATWECRDLAARHLTADQIADAERVAREW